MNVKIYLAADHAGFNLKEKIKVFLRGFGFEIEDCGAFLLNEEDDYPDFIYAAAQMVAADTAKGKESKAIVIGGSGQGEAIAANRKKGVRAAVYYGGPKEIVLLSRKHNDANILSIGARFVGAEEAKEVVKLWLETD